MAHRSLVRKILSILLYTGVALILVMAALEGILRLLWGNNALGRLLLFDHNQNPCVALRPDSEVVHTGLLKKIHPVRQRVNRFGYRGPARPPAKTAGVFRIIVVGDSFTFCPGVEEGQDYPTRLEYDLEELLGRPVEVLNFGVPSHNLTELEAHFAGQALRFAPDAVILQITQNDFSPSMCDMIGGLSTFRQWLLHHSFLARFEFIEYVGLTQKYVTPVEERLSALATFANRAATLAARQNIALFVTSFDEPVTCPTDCVGDLFRARNLPYLPFPKELHSHLNLDMGHLDAEGCDRYGRFLAEWLSPALSP